jgi:predicted DNA-binding transcriptional regulator AlpA
VAEIQNNTQRIPSGGHQFEPLLSEHDVAAVCGLTNAAIRRWRLLKKGPRYIKVGSAVRYHREDVETWLKTRPGGGEGAR